MDERTDSPSPPGSDETPGGILSSQILAPVSGPAAYRRARSFRPVGTGDRLADKVLAFAFAVSHTFPERLRPEYLAGDVCAHLKLRMLQDVTGLTCGALLRAIGHLDQRGFVRVDLANNGDLRLWLAPKSVLRAAA